MPSFALIVGIPINHRETVAERKQRNASSVLKVLRLAVWAVESLAVLDM